MDTLKVNNLREFGYDISKQHTHQGSNTIRQSFSLLKKAKSKLMEGASMYSRYNKYKNQKVEYKGIKFDSVKEANRYFVLKDMEKRGEIESLELQPKFDLLNAFIYEGRKQRKITYIADFKYLKDGRIVVEDVKGMKTEVYKIKRKIFLSKYKENITFVES